MSGNNVILKTAEGIYIKVGPSTYAPPLMHLSMIDNLSLRGHIETPVNVTRIGLNETQYVYHDTYVNSTYRDQMVLRFEVKVRVSKEMIYGWRHISLCRHIKLCRVSTYSDQIVHKIIM